MIITCPLCHQVCETDSEIEVGQRVQCPFCEGKFTYSEESRNQHSHHKQGNLCTACGAQIDQGSLFCPHCGQKIDAKGGRVKQSATAKSKKIMALLRRSLKKSVVCIFALVLIGKGCARFVSCHKEQNQIREEKEFRDAWKNLLEAAERNRAIARENERERERKQWERDSKTRWQCQNCGWIRSGKPDPGAVLGCRATGGPCVWRKVEW